MSGAFTSGPVLGSIALFMLSGPILVVVNREILHETTFKYPMCVSGMGVLCTSIFSHVLVDGLQVVKIHKASRDRNFFLTNCLPVGACQAASLALGNAVYMYLTVAFIQMLKAGTPVVLMTMLSLSGVEYMSPQVAGSTLVMAFGTALTSMSAVNWHTLGFIMMMMSELAEAGRCVLTQYVLKNLKLSVLESQYYLAPASTLCLFSVALVFEFPDILATGAYVEVAYHPVLFFLSGFMGIVVNFASFWLIQTTSSLFSKLLVTVRNVLLVLWGIMIYEDHVTRPQLMGYLTTLSAFLLYTYFKHKESIQKENAAAWQMSRAGLVTDLPGSVRNSPVVGKA